MGDFYSTQDKTRINARGIARKISEKPQDILHASLLEDLLPITR
jgi:hypothetical protein